jgi:hypothetical protein
MRASWRETAITAPRGYDCQVAVSPLQNNKEKRKGKKARQNFLLLSSVRNSFNGKTPRIRSL